MFSDVFGTLAMATILWIHFFSCGFMTGVIWLTQTIHYPAFRYIDLSEFKSFHDLHGRALTIVAAPLMIVELATAFVLCTDLHPFFYLNLFLVVCTWATTFLISVPLHDRLAVHFERSAVDDLVRTNWYRTGLWTLRSGLLVFWMIHTGYFIN